MRNTETSVHRSSANRALEALAPIVVLPLPRKYRRVNDKSDEFRASLRWALVSKRVFDVTVSGFLLVMLSPVFLLLSMLIPLDSPGSPFYSNKRIGLHGRAFHMLKFRTMTQDAHARRIHLIQDNRRKRVLFKHKNDPRVTRLGRWLRKYSLDELPQLVNVLRGEMSLIGSRPLLKEDFEAEDNSSALYLQWVRDRHLLWPGITGLWQVSGRNDLTFEQSMHLDLHYVTHWTAKMDVLILLKTLPAVLAGRGAY